MKFGSICSGIEAASVAFTPLGWKAKWFAEIDRFPSAVLAHYYPDVPNLGDMTKIHENKIYSNQPVGLLCGGTPCQSFSIAGLGGGLSDERGKLTLTFCKIAHDLRRKHGLRWLLWENVPGILSNKDNPFGHLLAGLAGANTPIIPNTRNGKWTSAGIIHPQNPEGFSLAWRILNAEYFGVPQSRRRIFVVGYFGDWRYPAKVLFESKMFGGDNKTGEEKGPTTAGGVGGGITESVPLAFKIRGGV